MPTVAETPWGHWGVPSPTNAWDNASPTLHGETGGNLKPGYADTLKWYYKRAKNQKDKEKCLQLLTQLEIKKESKRPVPPKRPQSAPKVIGDKSAKKTNIKNKQLATDQSVSCILKKSEVGQTYEEQLASTQRLSRPKTASHKFSSQPRQSKSSSDEVRPKSAMETRRKRIMDPYFTTHEYDFPGYPSRMYADAVRPMSTAAFIHPAVVNAPAEKTTFDEEYSWKTAPRVVPIRAATSSGNRVNKPHPDEGFMNWKLPRKNRDGAKSAPGKNLGYRDLRNEVLDQIIKDKMKSTYQSDYLGIPQGYQVREAIDAPFDWRVHVNRPFDTTARRTFYLPKQEPELVENTSRYGCNKKKAMHAYGVVPTVTKDHVTAQGCIKGNTTYEMAYQDSYNQPELKRIMQQKLSQNSIDKFLRFASGPSN